MDHIVKMAAKEAAGANVVNTTICNDKLYICFRVIFWQSNVGDNAPYSCSLAKKWLQSQVSAQRP